MTVEFGLLSILIHSFLIVKPVTAKKWYSQGVGEFRYTAHCITRVTIQYLKGTG
jgi:hypothetical protein